MRQYIDNETMVRILRSYFGDRVELWKTGGGVENPVVVLKRDDDGEALRFLLMGDGWTDHDAYIGYYDNGLYKVTGGEAIYDWYEQGVMQPRKIVKLVRSRLAVALAWEFSRIIRRDLTEEQLKEVVKENREESRPGVCHTHDYIDANEAMYEAFALLGLDPLPPEEEPRLEAYSLWGDAWDIALSNEFHMTSTFESRYGEEIQRAGEG